MRKVWGLDFGYFEKVNYTMHNFPTFQMTIDVAAPAASADVSRSNSEMSGSSESLNKDGSVNGDDSGTTNNILSEISTNMIINNSSNKPMAMGAKKKMSAPPKMLEEQTRDIRQQMQMQQQNGFMGRGPPGVGGGGGGGGLRLKIDAIQEEPSDVESCPPTAASECESEVEFLPSKTDILPWNIVTEPPMTNRSELYPIEGSWRLISNQVKVAFFYSFVGSVIVHIF